MTEVIVSSVLGKLCDVAIKEAVSQYNLADDVEWMKREFIRIRCFLRDAEGKRRTNESVKNGIREVRGVAYRIEDAIDTFLVDLDETQEREPGIVNRVKRMKKSLEDLPARQKLVNEIKNIREIIREISESRNNYGIQDLDERIGGEEVRPPVRRPILPEIDNTEVVGLEAHKKDIIERLFDRSTLRRSVISIVGLGGIGKTTLAQKAYKSLVGNREFECHIWLTVSQEFKLIELLKKMSRKLHPNESNENLDVTEIMTKIYHSLESKKYLIVLDDVWTEDLWRQFEATLPDANNGSRVLITIRNKDVALASSFSIPYELPFLKEKESEELLLKKALGLNIACPNDLLGLVKQFAGKCGGLPLALVVVGGLLSKKEANYTEWNKALSNINWKECTDILASSYDDLPDYLKPCFIYFARLPEDFKIREDAIIKMWVSEGFIPQEVEGIMEDTAASYLEELIQRCMVQTIEKDDEYFYFEKVRYLRIHDLLRDLAIHEAREESNITILSKESDRQKIKGPSRRATLQNYELELLEYTGPNLRSLLCFHNSKFHPDYSGFRLLKVLCFLHVEFSEEAKLNWLRELIHLRYLGFIDCWLTPELPHDIDHCKNLQTLRILGGNDSRLPESLWSIKALRHVIIKIGGGYLIGPPVWAELTNLLTIEGVVVPKSWMTRLPRLTSLRTLDLSIKDTGIPWDVIANLLWQLDHLISLTLTGKNFTRDILDTREFPSYENIQFLKLEGMWAKNVGLDAGGFPLHLRELILLDSNLEQDPMLELKKLVSLRVLVLGEESYNGNNMTCSTRGFHRLTQLIIHDLNQLEYFRIEENSMPMLNKLKVSCCEKMRMLPDLQHVPTLGKLELIYMPGHINSRVQNEDHQKIKHVPLIEIRGN